MNLTVCCATVYTGLPLRERIALVRELSVDAIEWWELPVANVDGVWMLPR